MYTRILARSAGIALILSTLPGMASAAMVMQGQRLRAASAPARGVGASSTVVSGDWIAVFGRTMGSEGGGQVAFYHRIRGIWTYTQTVSPPDAESCVDAMAMSGDTLFVACPRALDVDRQANTGVVAVYRQSGGQWQWTQTITSATAFFGNGGFGTSLAVSGDQLFVGYPGFAPTANAPLVGDVEVYDISAAPVTYKMQITPDVAADYSNFGSSLAAKAGFLAVGANNQTVAGIGESVGVVYTFAQGDGDWRQQSVLTAASPKPYDSFPSALTFQQSHLVAGSATSGDDDNDATLGAAFTYDTVNGSMSLDDVLAPVEAQSDTLFGQSLAAVGGTVFVGEPSGGIGGHVHVYNATASGWAHSSAFIMPTTQAGDQFGYDLATDGTTMVITALETPSTGMGSVYVFNAPPTDQIFGDGSEL